MATNNIWNPHMETMSRDQMRVVQSERLRDTVERLQYPILQTEDAGDGACT